jgi:lipopolysaccharide export system permease protein
LQAELAMPVLMAAMVLVGAMFCLRHSRAGGTGSRDLLTVWPDSHCSFSATSRRFWARTGRFPLLLAVWTPPLATILLALACLLHLEDG